MPPTSAPPTLRSIAPRPLPSLPLPLALLALLTACSPTPPPQNVVLISLDSTRADALTFLDADLTPNLARLAERGTIFRQALAGSSWTLPGHGQMFTGQPPLLHGAQVDDFALDPKTPTLPQLLSDAGWFTLGYWTGWYVAGEYGFARGFDLYENAMTDGRALEERYRAALARDDFDEARQIFAGRAVRGHQDVTSETVVERAALGLTLPHADQSLFLFAHFFDPHFDYLPPAPYDTRFDPHYDGPFDGHNWYFDTRVWDATKSPQRQIGDRDLQHVYALYRGELAWTDAALGRLLDELEASGRLDETLFVVTADHGEEFFEHGGRGHRHTLYEEQLRVPLLLVPPRGSRPNAPRTSDLQVTLSDILPTVLEFAGQEVPASVQGRSLLGVLDGRTPEPRPAVASLVNFNALEDGTFEYAFLEAWRTPEEKLIRTSRLAPDGSRELVRVEYFDLTASGGDRVRPVVDPEHPDVVRTWERLEEELDELRAAEQRLPRTSAAERATDITELFQDDLEKLGYAQGADDAVSPGMKLPWGAGLPPRMPLP